MTVIGITGAGGMIGRHLIDVLRNDDAVSIRALLLPEEPVPPSFRQVDVYRGDICKRDTLRTFLSGVDILFHLAALVGSLANRASLSMARAINVTGTGNVLAEAKTHGVKRLVLLSTCCVYGLHGLNEETIDESSAYSPLDKPYDLTKTEAEELVRRESTTLLPWTILQVPGVLGGSHAGPSVPLLSLAKLINFGVVPRPCQKNPVWGNYVCVGDVAAALALLSCHPAAIGQIFIWSQAVQFQALTRWIAMELCVAPWSLPLPRVLLATLASLGYPVSILTNRRMFSSQKIEKLLGFTAPIGIEAGLAETIRSYRDQRLLPFI